MKHPWQIWTLYAACLAIALPALGWLSWQAMELDRAREVDRQQTELARREAELQERISSALWRMDGMLTPLIAQEAARPYYLYESFYRNPSDRSNQPSDKDAGSPVFPAPQTAEPDDGLLFAQPSPLLNQPSEFVFLHFQIGPDNSITSPQRPTGFACQQAISCCGLSELGVANNDIRLAEIDEILDYQFLLENCPEEKLPLTRAPSRNDVTDNAADSLPRPNPASSIFIDPNVQAFQQLMEQTDVQTDRGGAVAAQGGQQKPSPPLQKQMAQQSRNRSRGNDEFNKRLESAGNYALNQWQGNLANDSNRNDILTPNVFVNEGIMRPLWIDKRLFLARRVDSNKEILIQGCWLDWEKIQTSLRHEVVDLLPDVQFQPLENANDVRLGQALATIPVQLVIDHDKILSQLQLPPGPPSSGSQQGGIKIALGVAWSCLGLAALAGAFLLHGLIRLSERRGAFVSAVTHELRTPLTTFRMYAEMLAERMVPSPEKQQQYAETMRIEADRLSHLVENVLQFARLERTGKKCRREPVTWNQLLDRFADRIQQRADQAAMKLKITIDAADEDRVFQSDPAAIEQIVFNLVDNSCKYARAADEQQIDLRAQFTGNRLRVSVRDYGPGIDPNVRHRVFRPFCKSDQEAADTVQGVGLGLALCRRMAKSLGGRLTTGSVDRGAKMVLDIPV